MNIKGVLIGAVGILLPATISATNWHLYKSWPAPAPNVRGYAYGSHYVLTDGNPPRVWPFDLKNFGTPITLRVPKGAWGLDLGGAGFLVSNYDNSFIYSTTTTGSVVSSFRSPRPHPAEIGKLALPWMYVAYPEDNVALCMTTTGSVVGTFAGLGTRLTAYHPWNGVLAGDAGTHKVYTHESTVSVPAVGGLTPGDWPMSGPYTRFFLTDMQTNTVQWWEYGGLHNVTPASLGRVKALFR